ncbi:MAG: glutamine synthetase [Desulfobacterales bacterium]|nr:glutamine synthetase [Desulfobacterales bacterium]
MTKEEILSAVRQNDIALIRFLYTDNDGVIRGYATTADELESDLDAGHAFSVAMPFFSVLDNLTPDTRFGCVGEIAGLPDPGTFRIVPYASNTAVMICNFVDKAGHGPTGLCARSILADYLAGLEFEVKAAFENEFYLLTKDSSGHLVPFDQSRCFATGAMNRHHEIVLDVIHSLKAQGIRVEKYYPEYGKGQVEIVTRYGGGLEAADNQVLFRETCRGVAHKHGLIASFMPKPFPDQAGSGAHLHLSLWKNGKNIFHDASAAGGISEPCRYFVGGILRHLKGLCAFTASTVNSYKRLVPHAWASAYTCWGIDNREVAVRAVSGMKGREEMSFNIEYKPVDGACNPYLALLSVLAAGIDGMENRIEPGPGVNGDPHDLPAEEKRAAGIERLPQTLGEAAQALAADPFFPELLGPVFVEEYLALKRFAWSEYIRQISPWETETYVDAF